MANYTLGVEEEIFVCDPKSGAPLRSLSQDFVSAIDRSFGQNVSIESMQCQFELKTDICADIAALENNIRDFRGEMLSIARRHNAGILCAGVHPFAKWNLVSRHATQVIEERATDYGILYFRGITGAFHLHVGLDDDDLRNEIAYLCAPFLPFLMALTVNSPLFESTDTGVKSYRLCMLNSRPRSGYYPWTESFARYQEIRSECTSVIRAFSAVNEPTAAYRYLGYARPNHRHSTLELRLFDGTPYLEDIMPVFAAAVSLTRTIAENLEEFREFRMLFSEELLEHNGWQAVTAGIAGRFILPMSASSARAVTLGQWATDLIEKLSPAAEKLGCRRMLDEIPVLARANRAADLQLAVYNRALAGGAAAEAAAMEATLALMGAVELSNRVARAC
jgi:carboxylate-amine ligase